MMRTNTVRRGVSHARAFTVLEMLVAIAAVAIIGVGLARLFTSTGDTVRIGRRVSALNDYAALIKRTIQADLESVSREGFMVIRHREVASPAGTGILLSPTDANPEPRWRRVDEWLFFANGRFTSLREPINPAKFPQGYSARIYYGHGLPRGTDPNGLEPDFRDDNLNAPSFGEPGPSQFASQWILLRHQAVLAPPNPTDFRLPSSVSAGALTGRWGDTPVQVGLQPAAYSLFRNEDMTAADLGPSVLSSNLQPVPWARTGESPVASWLSSGIVDVVAMDLSQVRQRVMASEIDPRTLDLIKPLSLGLTDKVQRPKIVVDQNPADFNGATSRMKYWMMYALPGGRRQGVPDQAAENAPQAPEGRMRCEVVAPNFLGTSTARYAPDQAAFKRADQLMLSASNFVPGCTEFIVEWSFGERYADNNRRAGELIWHGLPRYLDLDNDGQPDSSDPLARQADLYLANTSPTPLFPVDEHGTFLPWTTNVIDENGNPRSATAYILYPTKSELIHYPPTAQAFRNNWPRGKALYSCFGYVDPTYEQLRLGDPFDPNGTPDPNAPTSAPWPWPKFIRITMSLVDPTDPDNEQTYQFVFPVPERKRGGV